MYFLETARTYLREMTKADRPDLCEILQDATTMYAYEHAFSDAEVDAWLAKQQKNYRFYGYGLWALINKSDNSFLGQVGLTLQETGQGLAIETGYLLKRRYWGQGYATEGATACKEYAFQYLSAPKVVAIIRDNNFASQRVAERLGMHKEGILIKHYYHIDMPHFVYAIYPST